MITDMFAGSSQSVDFSPLFSSATSDNKAIRLSGNKNNNSDLPADFASLLGQTMNSTFSVEYQTDPLQSSEQEPSFALSSSSLLKSSFDVNNLSSSLIKNMGERNNLQKTFYASSNRNVSVKEAEETEKDDSLQASKDKTENEEKYNTKADEASETKESETTQASEDTKETVAIEESEETNDAGLEIKTAEKETEKTSEDDSEEKTAEMETASIAETETNEAGLEVKTAEKETEAINEAGAEEIATSAEETQTSYSDEKKEAKSDENSEKNSKLDEIVKELKENESVIPEESLRKEFARLTGQEAQSETNVQETQMYQQETDSMNQQANQASATSNQPNEETSVDHFLAEQAEKSNSVEGKGSKSQFEFGAQEVNIKGLNQNQNNSGTNNGFSFQSGSGQAYEANGKVVQNTAPTPSNSFAELLSKAEMVKTKDGAKVMSIEAEQEGIGRLELELISKDGEVTARLSAENEIAKVKLEELTAQIKDSLQEKGVNLTQISVDVSSRDADRNSSQYLNFGKRNKSLRLDGVGNSLSDTNIRDNILPNLRRQALNIQSIDTTV